MIILDDVKADDSKSLKDHTFTNIDILIRCSYDHNIDGETIYSNTILTGEFTPTKDSTLSRIVILPLEDFNTVPENLETLQYFQDNGYLKNHLSPRNGETLTTLKLGLDLLERFSCDNTTPSFKENIKTLIMEGPACFESLVKDTTYIYGDCKTICAELLCNLILEDKTIRSVPEVRYKEELNYFNYCVGSNENGIYISSPAVLSQIPYFKDPRNCFPYLLVRRTFLENLQYELENYCMKHSIPTHIIPYDIISECADFGFILVSPRPDKYADHIIRYPAIHIGHTPCYTDDFYCINLKHPLLDGLQKWLAQKSKQSLPVFHETSDEEFRKNTHRYDNYSSASDMNYRAYTGNRIRYELNKVKKDFQNLFDYRIPKPSR